jgi:hypothetical protein
MRLYLFLPVVFALLTSSTSAQSRRPSGTEAPAAVYVAEFFSRQTVSQDVLASFTELFETALINEGAYRVLNRRSLYQVLREAQNESHVRSMSEVQVQARRQIRSVTEAEGVIFGEVTDDSASGEVGISVTLETFDAEKRWKHATTISRGRLLDRASRDGAMRALAALVAGRRPEGGPDSSTLARASTRRCPAGFDEKPRTEDSFAEFVFRLDSLSIRGRTVSMKVFVTNLGPTRRLTTGRAGGTYGPLVSEIVDDCAQTFHATTISIAGVDISAEVSTRTTITMLGTFELPTAETGAEIARLQQVTLRFYDPPGGIAFRNVAVER